jgi:hypothetical protein
MGIGSKPVIEEIDDDDRDNDRGDDRDNDRGDDNTRENVYNNDEQCENTTSDKIKSHTTCPGCLSPFQANQLAHMGYGGCLYIASDESDEADESDESDESDDSDESE